MIGETILHYKILEKLVEGGMGEVYKESDTNLDRFVALKFLPSKLTKTGEEKARFIQEAKTASAMNHPNECNDRTGIFRQAHRRVFLIVNRLAFLPRRIESRNIN